MSAPTAVECFNEVKAFNDAQPAEKQVDLVGLYTKADELLKIKLTMLQRSLSSASSSTVNFHGTVNEGVTIHVAAPAVPE